MATRSVEDASVNLEHAGHKGATVEKDSTTFRGFIQNLLVITVVSTPLSPQLQFLFGTLFPSHHEESPAFPRRLHTETCLIAGVHVLNRLIG